MCDCFHLAFPNWHGSPGTGAGRRLKGPEPDAEDDSVCEDPPEFLEEERPRPQGSSPVNEYPVTEKYTDIDKQREEEIYDPYQKGNGSKKGKRVGFGSFFEKRSSAKMSQAECSESGMIVKTAKEACAEGLVVSGGGKEGIFIKEVKPESPAAKHLSVQEGDQILSATVYFDNVSYEDALQILEHAQPYRMELCVKRRPPGVSTLESSTSERQDVAPGEEEATTLERGRTKTQRRHDARISWPKFPSFSRGRKAHFKRSHSTSEAEEQRKLEMSPTTSDTESPIKSQEAVKEKTKKQKKLSKLKMKGLKSKSVEHQDKGSVECVSRSLENMELQQAEDVSDKHSPQKQESTGETPQIYVLNGQEKKGSTRIRNEYTFPETEISQHRAELISLDQTLKTTDISDFLVDKEKSSIKRSPEVKKKKKKERSELKVNIQGKEKGDTSPEGLLKSPQSLVQKTSSDSVKTPETGTRSQDLADCAGSFNVISQTELKGRHIAIDINTQRIDNKSIPKVDQEKQTISSTPVMGDMDICLPKVDVSLDMSDVGLLKKSPKRDPEKQRKERSILILDAERYGIKPRGPMADISMTKTYLSSSVNEASLSSSKGSRLESVTDKGKPKSPRLVTSSSSVEARDIMITGKDASIKMETIGDIQDPEVKIQASKTPQTNSGAKTISEFKMPKIKLPDFNVHEPILMTEVEASKTKAEVKVPMIDDSKQKADDSGQLATNKQTDSKILLLKREDIEIPGMEATALAGNQTPEIKLPETGEIDSSLPTMEIQTKKIQAHINVDEIKQASSKTDPLSFKLPTVDFSSLDVHQQITKSDAIIEKVKLDLTADVSQPKILEKEKGQGSDVINVPLSAIMTTASEHLAETRISCSTGEIGERIMPSYKLPKVEPSELDAHEPISMGQDCFSKTEVQISKSDGQLPWAEVDGRMPDISASNIEMCIAERPEIKLPKLPKREDIEIPGMEATSTTGNIQMRATTFPEIGKKDASLIAVKIEAEQVQPEITVDNIEEAISNINLPTFKLPKMDFTGLDVHEEITKTDANIGMVIDPKSDGKDQVIDPDVECKNINLEDRKGKFKIPPMPEFDISFPDIKSDDKLTNKTEDKRGTDEVKCISDAEIQITAESVIKADLEIPSTDMSTVNDFKVEVSDKKPKKTKVSMPTFGITKPDIRFPEGGVQVSLPKGEIDVEMATEDLNECKDKEPIKTGIPLVRVNTEATDIFLKGANLENEVPEGKVELQKITMPDISFPMQKTATEISSGIIIKGPSPENKCDISVKEITKEKLQTSLVEMPSLEISKPEIKGLQLSGVTVPAAEVSLTKPDTDIIGPGISGGEISVGVKHPELDVSKEDLSASIKGTNLDVAAKVDFDGKGVEIKENGSKFKVPIFGISPETGPEETTVVSMPEHDTQSAKVSLEAPDIVTGPKVETEKTKDKIGIPKVKMPDINVALKKIKGPKTDLKPGRVSSSISVSKPETHINAPEVDINIPSFEENTGLPKGDSSLSPVSVTMEGTPVDIKEPEITAKITGVPGSPTKIRLPSFKMPKFGIKSAKVTENVPEVTAVVTMPELETQSGKVSVEAPKIDLKGHKVKMEKEKDEADLIKVKTPDVSVILPKIKGPKVDLTPGQVETTISVTKPEIDIKAPEVDIKSPSHNTDISETGGVKGKFQMPHIKMPSFGISKPELKGSKIDADVLISKPDVNIKETQISTSGLSVDVKLQKHDETVSKDTPTLVAPQVDVEMKGREDKTEGQDGRFKLPKFEISLPKVKGPVVDIHTSKPNVDMSLPKVDAEAKVPAVEIDHPSVERKDEISDIDSKMIDVKIKKQKISLPKLGFSKSEMKTAETDVSLPKGDELPIKICVDIKGAQMDINASEIQDEIEGKPINISGSPTKFKLPSIKFPKVGISASKTKTGSSDVNAEVMVPSKKVGADIEVPDIHYDRSSESDKLTGKTELLNAKIPDIDISLPKVKGPEVNFKTPKAQADVSVPVPEIDTESLSLENVTAEIPDTESGGKVKFQMPHIKIPSFGISKVEIKSPKASGDISLQSKDTSLKEHDLHVKGPGISTDGTSIALNTQDTELQLSGKMPTSDLKVLGVDAGPAVDINMKAKEGELEEHGSKFKLPKFGISIPKIKGPTVDNSYSEQDASISLPDVKLEAQPPGTEVEGNINTPDMDSSEGDLKVKKPKVSLPKLGFSKPDIKGIEVEVNLPEGEISVPEMVGVKGSEIDIKSPDREDDINSKGSPSKFKLPSLKLPKFGVTVPKLKADLPELNAEKTKPDIEASSGVVHIEHPRPDMDIEKPDKTVDLSKVQIPKIDFSLSQTKGPQMHKNILADSELCVPDKDIVLEEKKVGLKGTSLDGQAEIPGIEVGAGEQAKFKMPHIKMPSLGFSKPEISGSKISGGALSPSVDISVTKPNIDINVPDMSADVPSAGVELLETELSVSGVTPAINIQGQNIDAAGTDVDVNIKERSKGVELEGPGGKFKLPKFGISFPKVKGPGVDMTGSKPDVDLSLPGGAIEGKLPDVEVRVPQVEDELDIPEVDGKEIDLKVKKPGISFPKFGISKPDVKSPEVEVSLPKGDISLPEASVEVKAPEVDIKSPKIEVKEDVDIKGSPSKFKLPTIKLPKFGITAPKGKIESPDLSAGITVPEIETPSSKVDIDLVGPKIDSEKPDGKFELPTIKMPNIDISISKPQGKEIHPEIPKGEFNIPVQEKDIVLPDTKVDLKGPSLDVQGEIPSIEGGAGGEGKFKMPHIKMPSFGFSKPEISGPKISGDIHLPSVDIAVTKPNTDINVGDLSADVPSVAVKSPETELLVSGETPAMDIKGQNIHAEGPEVDVDIKSKGVELEGQGGKFKLPKFGISLLKAKGPGVDITGSKPDVDMALPGVTIEGKLPEVDVKIPPAESKVAIPEMESKEIDLKVKKPRISFPKFGFSKPDVKSPEVEVSLPKGDIFLPEASVEVKAPEVDIKSPEIEVKEDADIKGSPIKFKLPTFKLPKFGITAPKGKIETPDLSAGITVPEIETPSSKVDIDLVGPGVDSEKPDGKFELPTIKMPDIDLSIPKPKGKEIHPEIPKGEFNIPVQEKDIVLPDTKVDLKGPSLDVQGEIPSIEGGAGGEGKFKMPHIKMPSFGFSKPEISGPKISGDIHLPSVDIAVTKPNTDINVGDLSADVPSVAVKSPETELLVSGETPAMDIKGQNIHAEGPEVDVDIKSKGVELEGQGGKFKLPKFGISLPKAKGPGVDITGSKPDVNISLPEVTIEGKLPEVDVKIPPAESKVAIPEMESKEIDLKVKKPRISFPKFGFSKPDIKSPEVEVSLPKGDISLPEASVEVKAPEVDIKSPEIEVKEDADIKGSPSKFKLPTFKLPKFGITAPKGKIESPDLSAGITVPEIETPSSKVDIDLVGPKIDSEKPDGKFELPTIKMPNIDISISKPQGKEIHPEIPKGEFNIPVQEKDIVLPDTKVDLKGPSLDVQGEIPSIEGGAGGEGKFKMPHIKMPSFGFSKPEISGPKISGDIHLPSVDIAVTKPKTDINVGDLSVDVPSVGVKSPETELLVSGETPAMDIKGQNIHAEGPEVDVDVKSKGVELEGQGGKFKLPKFGISLPKAKGPGVDITGSKPDVNISLPEVTIEGKLPEVDVKIPPAESKVAIPEMESKEIDLKVKKPRISFPKFGFSKPDVKSPEVEVSLPKGDIFLPEASVEVKAPEVDIKSPEIEVKEDADIKGSPSKFKLPTFKLPKFGITAPKGKIETPDLNAGITVPEIETPSSKVDIDLVGPGVDSEKPDGKFELPTIKMPNIDISISKPQGKEIHPEIPKGEFNIPVQEKDIVLPDTKVDLKGPSLDVQGEIPSIEGGAGGEGKFKMPHIKMPSFGFSKPEISGPKISGDIHLPSVDIAVTKPNTDINVGDLSADVPSVAVKSPETELLVSGETPAIDIKGQNIHAEGPEVDVDIKSKGVELEGQGGKFKLPKFGISLPKAKGPGVDITGSKPDVDMALPGVTIEGKLPEVDVRVPPVESKVAIPEMESKEIDLKVKKPRISFPKFGFSKPDVKSPEVEVSLPKGDISLPPEVEVSLPKGDVSLPEGNVEVKGSEVDVKVPETDIEIKHKEIEEIISSPTKFKLPTIKLPKFGISGPKLTGETSSINTDVTVPETDISSGQLKLKVESTIVDSDGSSIELNKQKGQIDPSKIEMPGIDVSLPKVKGFGINLKSATAETDVSAPKSDINIESSSFEGTAKIHDTEPAGKGKFQFPHIKMPSFGTSKPEISGPTFSADIQLPSVDVAVTKPNTDINVPDMSADLPSADGKLPEPELSVSGQTPAIDITAQNIDVQCPDVNVDIKGKGVEREGQGSKFKLPKFGISFPKVKESGGGLTASKPDVDISLPEVSVEGKLLDVEVEIPPVEGKADIPEDAKEADLKVKKPRISFPRFGFSKPEVKAPEVDVSHPKENVSLTEGSVEVKGPEVDIKIPETETEIKDKDMEIIGSPTKFKLPTFKFPKFGTTAPKSKVEAEEVNTDITMPETEIPSGKAEVDAGAAKFAIEADMSAMTPQVKTDLSDLESPALEVKEDISHPETAKTETEMKGSPSKFKLPTFKMPKFGFSTAKAKTADIDGDAGDTGLEITLGAASLETDKTNDGTPDAPGKNSSSQANAEGSQKSSKFNLPTIGDVFKGLDIEFNVPTLEEMEESLSSSRENIAQTGANEQVNQSTVSAEKDSNIKNESCADPRLIQLSTSHPSAEVSAQGPTITKEVETKERSKFKFRFPRLGFTESSEQDSNLESTNVVVEEKEKQPEPQDDKKTDNIKETETNTDKGTWFKFPKFGITSPTKTVKDSEKGMVQPLEDVNKSAEGDIMEEDVSLTSSVRSSDAFADISSTVTSEQVGPNLESPTKVKVKISEPTAMVGIGEVKVPSDIITSTARTELILLEPHLPEKIDTASVQISVPATLPSPDVLKQETGTDIHIVTSNIQATPSSEHAKVITKYETHSVQALSLQSMKVNVASASWTVKGDGEGCGQASGEKILVEKHVVKEKSGDDKGTVIITQKETQIVQGDPGEPMLGDTASAIKKLRDTMHSEKMKFFEDAEISTVTVSTHKIETHVEDTTTENK